jgi:uncharacterized metal-binding protein
MKMQDETKKKSPQCVKCGVIRCRTREDVDAPPFCPTKNFPELVQKAFEINNLPENLAIHQAWRTTIDTLQKGRDKWSYTRLDEILEYAKIRKVKKIGIATCVALQFESKLLSKVLEQKGFEVVSVSCFVGELNPQDFGLSGKRLCNPILQAELLNNEKTELNIIMGLCLGHDILFQKHIKADTTTLVVKDNSLGHNTVAALYLTQGYYRDRFL